MQKKLKQTKHLEIDINNLNLKFGRFQICWTLDWDRKETFGDNWNWERWNTIPTTTINSALAQHAITMLTICYIPGLFAAFIQLFRGTKYSRFPNWLDQWLRMRKQIGLLMLFSASLHVSLPTRPLKLLAVYNKCTLVF